MLRYAITDGSRFGADPAARKAGLLQDAMRWAMEGIDFVQLREKNLDSGELCELAEDFATIFRVHGGHTRLLVNHRADIAIAARAHGVHLTSRTGELTPAQVRHVFATAGAGPPVMSASCHSASEVERAQQAGADLILFGPVFEKRVGGAVVVKGIGLVALIEACRLAASTPVLALGGVTSQNSEDCLQAGASGIAGIRLFTPR